MATRLDSSYSGSAYVRWCSKISNMQLMTIRDHIGRYSTVESLLGFSDSLNERMMPVYNDSEYKESHPFGYLAHVMFSNNMTQCHASLYSLERSLYNPCAANLRSIWESLPKMFYLSHNTSELPYVVAKDHVNGMREDYQKKQALEQFLKSTIFGSHIDNVDDMLKKNQKQVHVQVLRRVDVF